MTADGFPSLTGRQLLRRLYSLGYEVERTKGSHRRLRCEGRPPLTFAFHDKATVPPGVVRRILVRDVGLTVEEALEAIR
jgi:predicted RNA binding protein YcfA (HicA-like mRNA interferase family)